MGKIDDGTVGMRGAFGITLSCWLSVLLAACAPLTRERARSSVGGAGSEAMERGAESEPIGVAERVVSGLNASVQGWRQRAEQLSAELALAREARERSARGTAELERELETARRRLDDSELEVAEVWAERSEFEAQATRLLESSSFLVEENDGLRAELAAARSALLHEQAVVEALRRGVEAGRPRDHLLERLRELNRLVRALRIEKAGLVAKIETLESLLPPEASGVIELHRPAPPPMAPGLVAEDEVPRLFEGDPAGLIGENLAFASERLSGLLRGRPVWDRYDVALVTLALALAVICGWTVTSPFRWLGRRRLARALRVAELRVKELEVRTVRIGDGARGPTLGAADVLGEPRAPAAAEVEVAESAAEASALASTDEPPTASAEGSAVELPEWLEGPDEELALRAEAVEDDPATPGADEPSSAARPADESRGDDLEELLDFRAAALPGSESVIETLRAGAAARERMPTVARAAARAESAEGDEAPREESSITEIISGLDLGKAPSPDAASYRGASADTQVIDAPPAPDSTELRETSVLAALGETSLGSTQVLDPTRARQGGVAARPREGTEVIGATSDVAEALAAKRSVAVTRRRRTRASGAGDDTSVIGSSADLELAARAEDEADSPADGPPGRATDLLADIRDLISKKFDKLLG